MQFDERASLKDLSLLPGLAGDLILARIRPMGPVPLWANRETHIAQLRVEERPFRAA